MIFEDWDEEEYEERYIVIGDIISFDYIDRIYNDSFDYIDRSYSNCRVNCIYHSSFWGCNLYGINVSISNRPKVLIGKMIRNLVFK